MSNQHDRDSAELRRLCAERDHLKACQANAQLHIEGLIRERDAALAECERLRELLREALPALQHISDTAQNLEDFTLAERVRSAMSAKP